MRLATCSNGAPDGELVVVSEDGARCLPAGADWPDLLTTIERWDDAEPHLRSLAKRLEAGQGAKLDPTVLRAPLPRSWQWLDGSAFATHVQLMEVAFGLAPLNADRPFMYQGMSDRFLGPCDDVPFPDTALGIDFEGEFGVIVSRVPMGVTPEEAMHYIRLVVQINDWSLRTIAPIEMKTGFGWVQAKPACSVAPFAVTPDALREGWRDGRVCLDLSVEWNGEHFGRVAGEEMAFSFPQLVAHAARTRELVAGTIIGSGTVSNADYMTRGSACISERRAIEVITNGVPETPFMAFGDSLRMEALDGAGRRPFGTIDQRVVPAF